MRIQLATIALLLVTAIVSLRAAETVSIIPQPAEIRVNEGAFELTAQTRIHAGPKAGAEAQKLAARLQPATGFDLRIGGTPATDNGLNLVLTDDPVLAGKLGREGYTLDVTPRVVTIAAATEAGLFYGGQTLLQLLPPEVFSSQRASGVKWRIPCVEITDAPRFPWRGLMLDVSRHFFNKEEVKQLLDAMALHKINTFHWHLVDDHGWRIEIRKYPRLTTVGAWREGVGFGLPADSTTAFGPDGRYGGFYTQDDIREVVAHAAARHITIVPEIEMPGHALAALAAYPEYGTGDGPFVIPLQAGVNSGIYSPAKPETFEFLQKVLIEVFQLFPSQYIHIGGDEVPKEPWKRDAACQALMTREGMKNEHALQSWFIRRMEQFINAHGKTLIGWSEIREGGIAPSAVLMDWIGGGREAAQDGHDVVMTPTSHCYFDYYQSRDHSKEPRAIGGFVPLEKVYSFEPVPQGLAADKERHILGAQGNVWTEYIPNLKQVEYMAFPRLSALAEVTWSPKAARDYDGFLRRLKAGERRLAALGVNYRDSALGDGSPGGVRIGGWQPSDIGTTPGPMEWDVTRNASSAGKVVVNFEYTQGAHGLDIAWTALLEDGREISRDAHAGFTGTHPRNPAYTLDLPAPKPGARYILRAQLAGSGGTDSRGNVYWNSKPAK